MIAGENIPDIPEYVERGSIRVHAPSLVIFICGGQCASPQDPPISLRDAFMRVVGRSPLARYELVLAEDPNIFSPIGEYTELLAFESDIAQLTELLLLFSESPGSLVELGMFVMDDEVSPKLMVVVDDKNYAKYSFIRLGPLFTLLHRHGDAAVCVLALAYLNIRNINTVNNINLDALLSVLENPLKQRLNQKREPRTFDKPRHGHVTKLITGLVQHYAALTLDEIEVLLFCLDVTISRAELKKHIQCAERFRWMLTKRIGTDVYCAARATASRIAIDFNLVPGAPIKDKTRWRSDIRAYWEKWDRTRFGVISSALLGTL